MPPASPPAGNAGHLRVIVNTSRTRLLPGDPPPSSRPSLPVALSNVETGTYGAINYGLLLAGAVIAMIPCIVVYVALQRYYVRGLISGALKG